MSHDADRHIAVQHRPSLWSKLTGRSHRDPIPTMPLPAEDLLAEAAHFGACTVLGAVPRAEVCVQGDIVMLKLTPKRSAIWLEADLDDGTGIVRLIWMGRSEIPGIRMGVKLRVRGRLALDENRKVIFNPYYQLLAQDIG
jgi:hypothetical protein